MQEIHIYRPYRQEMWFSKMAADGWPPTSWQGGFGLYAPRKQGYGWRNIICTIMLVRFAVWFVVTLVKLVKLVWLLVNSVTLLPPTGNNCSENSANLKKREEAILRSFKYWKHFGEPADIPDTPALMIIFNIEVSPRRQGYGWRNIICTAYYAVQDERSFTSEMYVAPLAEIISKICGNVLQDLWEFGREKNLQDLLE